MRVFMFFLILGVIVVLNNLSSRFASKRRDSSLTFIAGEVGAGKSAYAARLARRALRAGRTVYSTDYIEGCYQFDVDWLHNMKAPPNSLVIIDEAALSFNSRNFSKIQVDVLSYFKRARHFGNDVVLISQTFGDTDKQIREVCNNVLFIRKIGWISVPLRVRGRIGVGDDGQPAMIYRVGKFGRPYIPAKWGKYYDSFNDVEERPFCPEVPWDALPSSPVEMNDVCPDFGASDVSTSATIEETAPDTEIEATPETGSVTISGTNSAPSTSENVRFTEDDAKKLLQDFKIGKRIDLSKLFPEFGPKY